MWRTRIRVRGGSGRTRVDSGVVFEGGEGAREDGDLLPEALVFLCQRRPRPRHRARQRPAFLCPFDEFKILGGLQA